MYVRGIVLRFYPGGFMAEATPVMKHYQLPKLSTIQLALISAGLEMLRVSSLRAVAKEVDPGIRAAREARAHAVKALEVHLHEAVEVK